MAVTIARSPTTHHGLAPLPDEPQGMPSMGPAERDAADKGFMAFLGKLATEMEKNHLILTIDIGGCPQFNDFVCSGAMEGLAQVNTMHTFETNSVQSFKMLAGHDASALDNRWAPGFEPANCGPDVFGPVLKMAAQMGAQRIATWEVHECNVGAQPQWLFDAVNTFLDY
jgi:hypothetical protein